MDATGSTAFSFLWPVGVPANVSVFYQFWISDPTGALGFSASNGLQGTTP